MEKEQLLGTTFTCEQVVTEDGITLTAKEVVQNRIEKVLILLPENQDTDQTEASSEAAENKNDIEA